MITAAAALNEHAGYQDRAFVCSRLPSGRIGVRIPGFGPPIHDDSHDTAPHGAISLRDATVRSCNAYFAQLAVAVGADALTHTAASAGISLNTSRAANRVRVEPPARGLRPGRSGHDAASHRTSRRGARQRRHHPRGPHRLRRQSDREHANSCRRPRRRRSRRTCARPSSQAPAGS